MLLTQHNKLSNLLPTLLPILLPTFQFALNEIVTTIELSRNSKAFFE